MLPLSGCYSNFLCGKVWMFSGMTHWSKRYISFFHRQRIYEQGMKVSPTQWQCNLKGTAKKLELSMSFNSCSLCNLILWVKGLIKSCVIILKYRYLCCCLYCFRFKTIYFACLYPFQRSTTIDKKHWKQNGITCKFLYNCPLCFLHH